MAEWTPRAAVAHQRVLAARVVRRGRPRVRSVLGMDTSVRAGRVVAALCLYSFPALEPRVSVTAERALDFPYVPGLLAYRELPALLAAYARLPEEPDLLLVDGHGLAHPRRCGIACHLGVELARPSIGCGKSLLVGTHRTPGPRRGAHTRLVHRGEVVGACLRTRSGVRPVYVSSGHRIELEAALALVLACARGFRLPEPIRAADHLAGARAAALPPPDPARAARAGSILRLAETRAAPGA
ncbi:MAG TPA: endonuclease V [Planctomycetota bacterium]